MEHLNRLKRIGIAWLIGMPLLICFTECSERPAKPMRFIAILPSQLGTDDTKRSLYREDSFAIENLDRSDKDALLMAVARHACQVIDTVALEKYASYHLEYYEHGEYMNDSTMNDSPFIHHTIHRKDEPLWHVADELDAFVYSVGFKSGHLDHIIWYPSGEVDDKTIIKVTKKLKGLFNQCH